MTDVTNIAQTFEDVARKYGNKKAVIEAKSGRSIDFQQLDVKANNYAHYFHTKGVLPGEIVVLMVTPSIEFICLALALFKLGSPVVLIDPGMGYKNLLRCIERVKPLYLVGIPKAILFSKLFSKPFRSVKARYCCGSSWGLLGKNINKVASCGKTSFPAFKPSRDDLAAIIFTTGSTGPPKGVQYEHSIFAAQLKLIEQYYKIGPDDTDQPAFPLFALFSAALGACSVIPDMNPTKPAKVNPKKFIDSITRNGVSYSFGSPAIWNVVSRYCIENNLRLPTLKKVLMAGAPVPYDTMARVRDSLPHDAQIYTPYGATESLPIVSIESREVLNDTYEKSRIGRGTCVGRALPGIEIEIIELSDEVIEHYTDIKVLPANKIGEIIVQGDVVTRAYLNNPHETRLAKIKGANKLWHRMGDVGYLDELGRLWFCGRRAHRVVTKSQTFFPIPCEAILNEHKDIFRSALVGVVNRSGDVEPVLIIEPVKNRSQSTAELMVEAQLLGAASDITKEVQHFLIYNDFPVDIRHNAKIFREKLATWAQKKIYP